MKTPPLPERIEALGKKLFEDLYSVPFHPTDIDACHLHEKHTPQCHDCRKRKMYVEYSKDWKKSIDERLKSLQQQLKGGLDA